MNDTPSETTKAPTPPNGFTIKRILLALTGGEQGCPRKRFFISIALAAPVLLLLTRVIVATQFSAYRQPEDSSFFWLQLLLTVLTSLAMLLGETSAGLFTVVYARLSHYLGFTFELPHPVQDPHGGIHLVGTELPSICYPLCCIVLILACLVAFCLAWRRLRDAGYSPWHLPVGLWACIVDGVVFLGWLNDAFYWCSFLPGWPLIFFVFRNLGRFWLLYLFCKPTREPTPNKG